MHYGLNFLRMLMASKNADKLRLRGAGISGKPARVQLGRMTLAASTALSLSLMLVFSTVNAMTEMRDSELAGVVGQALMQMGKTESGGFTFYKAGLDVELEINLNIEKLQLGCTANAINGQHCDIDIDHVSLSGPSWTQGRPDSSAILTRPFFEFAIRNDDKSTLREVVGIRMSAENASGMLTTGENGPDPSGINSLSGYMVTTPITGRAYTEPTNLGCGRANEANCAGGIRDPYSTVLTFDTHPNVALCTAGCYAGNTSTSDPSQSNGVYIPELAVDFYAPGAVINGRRQTSTSVTAMAPVPAVSLQGGQIFVNMEDTISVAGFINVDSATVNLAGSVSGLETQINFTEGLGYIHKINVDSPFSLSFQHEPVQWPGAAPDDVAQEGWWMSFRDPVDLGVLNPSERVDITPTFAQMAQAFNNHFAQGCTQPCAGPIPIETRQGLDQLFSGQMTVDVGAQVISTAPLLIDLSDLQLSTQNVTPNCWGSATFC